MHCILIEKCFIFQFSHVGIQNKEYKLSAAYIPAIIRFSLVNLKQTRINLLLSNIQFCVKLKPMPSSDHVKYCNIIEGDANTQKVSNKKLINIQLPLFFNDICTSFK